MPMNSAALAEMHGHNQKELAEQHQQNQKALEKHLTLAQSLEGAASSFQSQLDAAQQKLDALVAKRQEMARQIALGNEEPEVKGKRGSAETLSEEISKAQLRVDGFKSILYEKRAEVASHSAQHDELRKAVHDSGVRLHMRTVLENIEARGSAAVARINEKIRALLTVDFVEWMESDAELGRLVETRGTDQAGRFDPIMLQSIASAREVLATWKNLLWEGFQIRVVNDLLGHGWEHRVNVRFDLPVLNPPRAPRDRN